MMFNQPVQEIMLMLIVRAFLFIWKGFFLVSILITDSSEMRKGKHEMHTNPLIDYTESYVHELCVKGITKIRISLIQL